MVGRKAFARLEVTAHAALGAFVLAADTDGLAGGSENLRHGYLVPDERAHSEHSPIVIAAIAFAAAVSPADRTFIRNAIAIDSTNLLQQPHRAALALFTRESRKGGNAALRDFAKRTLSVVRSNLIQAQHYLKQELSREKHGGL